MFTYPALHAINTLNVLYYCKDTNKDKACCNLTLRNLVDDDSTDMMNSDVDS